MIDILFNHAIWMSLVFGLILVTSNLHLLYCKNHLTKEIIAHTMLTSEDTHWGGNL